MPTEWSNLAKIIARRTYSRRDSGSLETWPDIIERVIRGNCSITKVTKEEQETLRRYMLTRKAIPAGRGLWFSGSPAHSRIGGKALNNCWFLTAEDWQNFVLAQDLLMLGGGVGLSVEHRFVSKLPKVKRDVIITHDTSASADFIVPDTREGWCELTRRVLESYFLTGRSFSFSTCCVRGAGERIHGFGGIASGPLPLCSFVRNLGHILEHRSGKHIRPIDAADIICATGEMVVSGNVRRSAIIILGDCFDKEYLLAKRWDLTNIPSFRSCANYSVICDDVDDLHPSFWKTYENGEPYGLVNRRNIRCYGRMGERLSDTAMGVNPCQPGWATVLTPTGISTFDNIHIGDLIWSGQQWTTVRQKKCTGIKEIFEYKTTAGVFYGTSQHNIIQKGLRVEAQDAEGIDRNLGPYEYCREINNQDIIDGLVYGDGSFHKASNRATLYIGTEDHDYFGSSQLIGLLGPQNTIGPNTYNIQTTLTEVELPVTYNRKVPQRFFRGSRAKVRGFLRGLYTANGSICGNRITLKGSSFISILQVQQMLSGIGIASYYTTNKPTKVKFVNGEYECKESYDLNITSDRYKFCDFIGFIQKYKYTKAYESCAVKQIKPSKITYDIVETKSIGFEDVYDISVEADEHTYWTGGLLVSNCAEATLEAFEPCNLQEIALMNISDEKEFIEAAVLMHRYGKRVTLEDYKDGRINSVIRRNRRIGTGITGCLGSPLFSARNLDATYKAIARENHSYSKELGIPESIRTTLVKPSGTVSKLLDMQGYEGLHPAYSRYMIQRVRFAASDALIPLLRAAGHKIEPEQKLDGSINHGTLVVDFYQAAPQGMPVADEDWDTWKQLDTLMLAQRYWADQACSVTVYYNREDIPKLKGWLSENLQYLKTISFLCHSGHGFKQAPKEAITQEVYNKAIERISPIDVDTIGTGADLDGMECSLGVCPVK